MSVIRRNGNNSSEGIKIKCVGEGWQIKNSACNRVINVAAEDIITKKNNIPGKKNVIKYGFLCPLCGCFTAIPKDVMPKKYKCRVKN